jgi:hypothetical protein
MKNWQNDVLTNYFGKTGWVVLAVKELNKFRLLKLGARTPDCIFWKYAGLFIEISMLKSLYEEQSGQHQGSRKPNGSETKIPSRSENKRNKRVRKMKSHSHIWDDVERGACTEISLSSHQPSKMGTLAGQIAIFSTSSEKPKWEII